MDIVSIVLMGGVLVAMFFFMTRSEKKKKQQAAELRAALAVGDEVTTIGGIIGTICAVKEETIVIESGADRVRIELTKWAVSGKGSQTEQTR